MTDKTNETARHSFARSKFLHYTEMPTNAFGHTVTNPETGRNLLPAEAVELVMDGAGRRKANVDMFKTPALQNYMDKLGMTIDVEPEAENGEGAPEEEVFDAKKATPEEIQEFERMLREMNVLEPDEPYDDGSEWSDIFPPMKASAEALKPAAKPHFRAASAEASSAASAPSGRFRPAAATHSEEHNKTCVNAACSQSLPYMARFCSFCGVAQMGNYCMQCGYKFDANERFCPECGQNR